MTINNTKDKWLREHNNILLERLQKMNVYDLERLRACFEWELKARPEDREYIENIIAHINHQLGKE